MVDINSIRTDSWDAVYNLLQTGTHAITTNNIFSSWNSQLIKDKGHPMVIIKPSKVDIQKLTVKGNTLRCPVELPIEVYHNNSKNCKAVADEVTAKLIAGRIVLTQSGLYGMEIESVDEDSWQDGKTRKEHFISFNATFTYTQEKTPN